VVFSSPRVFLTIVRSFFLIAGRKEGTDQRGGCLHRRTRDKSGVKGAVKAIHGQFFFLFSSFSFFLSFSFLFFSSFFELTSLLSLCVLQVYKVMVNFKDKKWAIYRRYSDFHTLHQKVRTPFFFFFDFIHTLAAAARKLGQCCKEDCESD